jgi:peptide/nickel transport system substrate-binding protein
MKRSYWLLPALLVVSLALAACGGAGGGAEPVTVIIGSTDEISSLDFADAYATHDWELFRNVNIPLMTFEPGTGEVVPGTAVDWPEVSDDGLTYTFTLSDGWKYPDGTDLVAEDYVRGVNRALTVEGDVAGLVVTYVDSVEAPDDQTVVFHLTGVYGYFPQIVTGCAYMPVREGDYPADELNKFPDTLQGVGPYQITEYNVEEQVVMERNPNYKLGFSDTAPERVIIRYFEDPAQMALAVENAEIDIAWRILGLTEAFRLGDVEGLTAYNSNGGGIRYLVLNEDRAPFDDVNARKALAYLIDRDEIIDRALQGLADPLYSMVPTGFLGANEAFLDVYGSSPDVAAAEDALTAAGYSEDSPLAFDLWYPPEHYGAHAAQIFQILEEQFEATPMIDVTLQSQEWGTYVSACTGGEYEACYLGWFYDFPDPSNYIEPFAQSVASPNMGIFYASDEMDGYLADGAATSDPGERATIYENAQDLYAEDVVTIPLDNEVEYAVYREETIGSIDSALSPALVFNYEEIVLK